MEMRRETIRRANTRVESTAEVIADRVTENFFKQEYVGIDGFKYSTKERYPKSSKEVSEVFKYLYRYDKVNCLSYKKQLLFSHIDLTAKVVVSNKNDVIEKIESLWAKAELEHKGKASLEWVDDDLIVVRVKKTETSTERDNRIKLYKDVVAFIRAEYKKIAEQKKAESKEAQQAALADRKAHEKMIKQKEAELRKKRQAEEKKAAKDAKEIIDTLFTTPEQKKAASKVLNALKEKNLSTLLGTLVNELNKEKK